MTASLLDRVLSLAEENPRRLFMIDGQRESSYGDLLEGVRHFAGLLSPHVDPGDRVCLLLDAYLEYPAACYGVWLAGGAVVGLNTALKFDALLHLIRHSQARVLVADRRHPELKKLREALGDEVVVEVVEVGAGFESAADASAGSGEGSGPSRFGEAADGSAGEAAGGRFGEAAAGEGAGGDDGLDEAPRTPVDPEGLAAIIYTSGTTGRPKGVMLSHGNLAANTDSICEYLDIRPEDRTLCVLPFYYSYGASILNTHLVSGSCLIVERSFMYPHAVLERASALKATSLSGVPSTFYLLLKRTDLSAYDLSSMRYFTQAGGGMEPERIAEFRALVPGADFVVMYGQTEASARLAYVPPEMLPAKTGSAGKGIPGVELKVVGEGGKDLPRGDVGEVCARGPNVMMGYWRDPEGTGQVLKDGWLHTGDLGRMDEDGFLFLKGRSREMIKSGAHRIAPLEIEEVIRGVEGVDDVAVVGAPDDILGQAVKACIITRGDEAAVKKAVMMACRRRLPLFKVPTVVEFRSDFPRTASGKVRKHLLADPAPGS